MDTEPISIQTTFQFSASSFETGNTTKLGIAVILDELQQLAQWFHGGCNIGHIHTLDTEPITIQTTFQFSTSSFETAEIRNAVVANLQAGDHLDESLSWGNGRRHGTKVKPHQVIRSIGLDALGQLAHGIFQIIKIGKIVDLQCRHGINGVNTLLDVTRIDITNGIAELCNGVANAFELITEFLIVDGIFTKPSTFTKQ